MGQAIKHIFILLTLGIIISSTALQYTHTHGTTEEDCPSSDHTHHSDEHIGDTCSLCWFIAHQLIEDFSFYPYTGLPVTQTISIACTGYISSLALHGFSHKKTNKDPPMRIA